MKIKQFSTEFNAFDSVQDSDLLLVDNGEEVGKVSVGGLLEKTESEVADISAQVTALGDKTESELEQLRISTEVEFSQIRTDVLNLDNRQMELSLEVDGIKTEIKQKTDPAYLTIAFSDLNHPEIGLDLQDAILPKNSYFDTSGRVAIACETIPNLIRFLQANYSVGDFNALTIGVTDDAGQLLGEIKINKLPDWYFDAQSYVVWLDTAIIRSVDAGLRLSWKWTRYDLTLLSISTPIYRVLYYTEDMEVFFPYDAALTSGGTYDSQSTERLFGALAKNDFSALSGVALDSKYVTLLLYAYQAVRGNKINLQQNTGGDFAHMHSEIRVKVVANNNFIRPTYVDFSFSQRYGGGTYLGDIIVRMRWEQTLNTTSSASDISRLVNMYDVDALFVILKAGWASGQVRLQNLYDKYTTKNPITPLLNN